jgi:restriction endonuclease S subunit
MPVPTLPEQQKIAKILDACDKVISLKEKLLEEKRKRI